MPCGSSKTTASPVGLMTRNPVVTVGVIMYATFALLIVAIPQSVVNWVKDFNPSPTQEVMLAVAESIEAMSGRLGANVPYRAAREILLQATGKNDD